MAQTIDFIDLKAQRQRIRTEIDAAIARVLEHGQFIMGPEVTELESRLSAYTGARHTITCASGTDALMIAMMAKGLGRGDAVLCPAFTYTATPESIALLGASPVFVDVDEASFNLSPDKLEAGLAAARSNGLRPVGMIVVDLFGLPADYDAIHDFAASNGLWILADGAQSFGGTWRGRKVGSLAEITATSFFPAKPLGCYGDGGAIFTDDDDLAEVMRSIRLHGRGREKYEVVRVGVNGRLDTLQAAILLEKLNIFDDELAARERIAHRYSSGLSRAVGLPVRPNHATSAWAQYTVRIPDSKRDTVIQTLAARHIPTQVYYPRPLHHQTAFADYPVAVGGVPTSEKLPREVLSLPFHPYLSADNQDAIISHFNACL